MSEGRSLAGSDVLVLCGGLGLRLRPAVADRPKPLADVDGRPFLDLVLDHAASFGARRFILCAGFKGERIRERYSPAPTAGADSRPDGGREIAVLCEDRALGTAGALRHAASLLHSPDVLVLNGDSLCRADLGAFLGFHARHGGEASVVLAPREEGTDYGVATLDPRGRVASFAEKAPAREGQLVNAGIYLFSRRLVSALPAAPSSLEQDVLPALSREGRLWGWPVSERVLDIGTPERYERARRLAEGGFAI